MHDHHDHHIEEHFTSSELVRDVVIGMADGLTVPFALAAGISGAVDSNVIVITAGIAEIIAGSIAMGLGGYLAGKTEVDHYAAELKREYYEVDHLPEREKQEVKDVLGQYGISIATQNQVAEELSHNKDKWVDFMMKFELGLEKPHPDRAKKSAFNIAVSYIIGGFIPLSAYFFTPIPNEGIKYSAIITLIALAIFGFYKSKLTGQNKIKGALRTMLVGAAAAAAAYFIATWIGKTF